MAVHARGRVSVVIVSYQVRDLLRCCLASVRAQRGVEVEIWVVDNASQDGSADVVAAEFPEARLIRNPENLGFARACNQALAEATGGVLLLLNPDTELPEGALAALVEVFGRHPRAAAVGPALRNPDGTCQPSCHAFPGLWNQAIEALGLHRIALRLGIGTPSEAPAPRSGEGPVDWVSGACLALSREAYEHVGSLNPVLFMYGEEMDWCWRARRAGYVTVHSDRVAVVHHGGASGEGLHGPLFARNLEARLVFLWSHRGLWRAALARGLLFAGVLLRLAYWSLRALGEGSQGRRPRTRLQLERFRAAIRHLLSIRR